MSQKMEEDNRKTLHCFISVELQTPKVLLRRHFLCNNATMDYSVAWDAKPPSHHYDTSAELVVREKQFAMTITWNKKEKTYFLVSIRRHFLLQKNETDAKTTTAS